MRWPALVVAAITLALAIPHLDLLFVQAFPTSFYTSPTEFAATAIVHGAKLFAANCVVCHGAEGRGDGPAAKSLPWPPADLTADTFGRIATASCFGICRTASIFISNCGIGSGCAQLPIGPQALSGVMRAHIVD